MIKGSSMLEGFHRDIFYVSFLTLFFFLLKLDNNDKTFQDTTFRDNSHFKKLLIVPSQGKEEANLVV